jgi:DNA phosphorothioation-associated putative methyltransferase
MSVDIQDYQLEVAELRFGKRVGTSVYFHEGCSNDLPPGLRTLAFSARASAESDKFKFNVYKFDTRAPIISLLNYPAFFDDAFPTLSNSANWNPDSGELNKREYSKLGSQPVLHRKELLLPTNHQRLDEFATLTEVAEQLGLFDDPSRIGRYEYWSTLLNDKGISIVGHSLRRSDGSPMEIHGSAQNVLRYRTALKRNRLSVPIQLLYTHKILDTETTLFDYGCGRGDDIRLLSELGVAANGWDPYFSPDNPKRHADIVNLGYVVNVIENPAEREQVIAHAYGYANGALVVSALVGTPNYSESARKFQDGFITSAGTFQRYFQQEELADLIERSVGIKPHSVARGVMFVFKSEALEQEFLARRFSRRQRSYVRVSITNLDQLNEDAQSQANKYWERSIELGRPARRDEVDDCGELFRFIPSPKKVHELVGKERKGHRFEESRRKREEELLVQFALSQFGRRMYFKYFPDELKRDIEFHFGAYRYLTKRSKELLFSVADIDALLAACVDASDEGVGYLLDDHSLQLHLSLAEKLGPILRVYIGCAGILYGEWAQVDLVKVHIQSGKVSFMGYDDFEGRPVPELIERIKVKMWEREVDYFDYVDQFVPTPLFMKSLYIDESFDYYEEQAAFDQELMRTRLFDFMRDNVSKAQFHAALEQARYRINGYELAQVA